MVRGHRHQLSEPHGARSRTASSTFPLCESRGLVHKVRERPEQAEQKPCLPVHGATVATQITKSGWSEPCRPHAHLTMQEGGWRVPLSLGALQLLVIFLMTTASGGLGHTASVPAHPTSFFVLFSPH